MITWREEGERSVAMLGKIEVGRVIASDFEDGYMAYLDLKSSGPIQRYWTSDLFTTLPAAKVALAEAVAKWCGRAGLVKDEGWQPIESAPKDATSILIYIPGHRKPVQEAWWSLEYDGGPGYWSTPLGPTGRGYVILPTSPTRWRPLPTPPARS